MILTVNTLGRAVIHCRARPWVPCHLRALLGQWPLNLAFPCYTCFVGLGAGDAAIWALDKESLLVRLHGIHGTLKHLIVIDIDILIGRGQVYSLCLADGGTTLDLLPDGADDRVFALDKLSAWLRQLRHGVHALVQWPSFVNLQLMAEE